MQLVTLRASSAPIAFLCGASVRPVLRINELSEAADIGSAAHAALRSLAETGRLDWDAIPGIAKAHNVPEDEVRILCAQAVKLWEQVKDSFPDALTEVALQADVE